MEQIEIQNLYVSYDQHDIISGMNLSIPQGKITMIIGPNGCGKSTLLKSIARILKPRKGNIYIKGKDIRKQNSKDMARHVAVLPQNPKTPDGLLVKELVAYGRFPHQNTLGGLSAHDIEVIQWAMEETSVTEYADRTVDSLSGGQRQRAWIAMALAQETEILLLDEPTTYLDMSHQLEILLLLQKLNRKEGRSIVIVLHELNNACRFSDYIIGMKNGKIIFSGSPKEVITEDNLYKIYGINAKLAMDKEKQYPICVEYDF